MSLRIDLIGNNLVSVSGGLMDVLKRNPDVSNRALASIAKANLTNFSGAISISYSTNPSETNGRPAKVVYITPYEDFYDMLVNIKRWFMGVQFPLLEELDVNTSLAQGRRITIFLPVNQSDDQSEAVYSVEGNQKGCIII